MRWGPHSRVRNPIPTSALTPPCSGWPRRRWTAWTSSPSRPRRCRAAHAVRRGEGPRFLETKTYRFRAHSMFDPDLYRDKAEVENWKKRDPIARFTRLACRHESRTSRRRRRARGRNGRARSKSPCAFAEAAPWEPVEDLTRDVYTRLRVADHRMSESAPHHLPRGGARGAARGAYAR